MSSINLSQNNTFPRKFIRFLLNLKKGETYPSDPRISVKPPNPPPVLPVWPPFVWPFVWPFDSSIVNPPPVDVEPVFTNVDPPVETPPDELHSDPPDKKIINNLALLLWYNQKACYKSGKF